MIEHTTTKLPATSPARHSAPQVPPVMAAIIDGSSVVVAIIDGSSVVVAIIDGSSVVAAIKDTPGVSF